MNILIVDDSRTIRMIIRRTLRMANIGHHVVEEAEDGQDALRKLEAFPADLILSDWNMPNLDGLELLEAVRAAGNNTVAFGFVTSSCSSEAHERATAAGASFFVDKPFKPEDIYAALKPMLKEA
jgi:two-component system chemotaxis response regulator CheY